MERLAILGSVRLLQPSFTHFKFYVKACRGDWGNDTELGTDYNGEYKRYSELAVTHKENSPCNIRNDVHVKVKVCSISVCFSP